MAKSQPSAKPVLIFLIGAVLLIAGLLVWIFVLNGGPKMPAASVGIEAPGPALPDLKLPSAPRPTGQGQVRIVRA